MIEITDILDVEKHIADVDAVIFDLDDTLYSEKEYVRSGYKAIANYLGIPELAEEMWQVFEKHGKPIDEVLERHGMISKKIEAVHIYRFHKPNIHLYPGVNDMLLRISKNKKLGIITDGRPEGQRAKIEALGLRKFETIITDELGGIEYRKPNDLAFQIMQSKLQTPFERMIYVGDNIRKDFLAPEKCGMKWVHFKNTNGIYGG